MTKEEARKTLLEISYALGNMGVEYLSEKDGEKMREAIQVLEQHPRDCKTCKHSDKGNCAGTEECHECMWSSKYEQQPSDNEEIIRVSKGAVKARQGRFVIYDTEWLKEHFNTTEAKLYGQPCEDCISRQETIDAIKKIHPVDTEYDCTLYDKIDVMYVLEDLPSVTPQPKIGRWIDEGFYAEGHSEHAYRCSECDEHYIGYVGEFNFCPNCGAKMQEVRE